MSYLVDGHKRCVTSAANPYPSGQWWGGEGAQRGPPFFHLATYILISQQGAGPAKPGLQGLQDDPHIVDSGLEAP